MLKHLSIIVAAAVSLAAPASSAMAAADTGANANPSCIGLFSSADDIRAGLPRSYYAQLAAHSGVNPGELLHSAVGGPGEHC